MSSRELSAPTMVELCPRSNGSARWTYALAWIGALVCESAAAQSTVAISGEGPTTRYATPLQSPASGAAAAGEAVHNGAILEFRRDDPANNPLRAATDVAANSAVTPAAVTNLTPEELAAQARAAAAFAPAEPAISSDAPSRPLVTAVPLPGAASPASPANSSGPPVTAPAPASPAFPVPPAATAEDYATEPMARYDAVAHLAAPAPLPSAGTSAQAAVNNFDFGGHEPSPPTFTLPASAAEAVAPAADVHADADSAAASRRLAPEAGTAGGDAKYRSSAAPRSTLVPTAFGQLKGLASAGGALALVVGLFVACALLLRRGGPKPTGVLPPEAFAVLGRAPLTAQSFAQLLRLGNKLVLVAVTADGAQPLAEVNDPAEVDRIAGLCLGGGGSGPSAEFQQVLAQLAREPAKGFLGREGSSARRRA